MQANCSGSPPGMAAASCPCLALPGCAILQFLIDTPAQTIMIGYCMFGTNDLARAATFYDALLAEMGAKRLMDFGSCIVWGTTMDRPSLGVGKPYDGQAASVGNGVMVALMADSKATVDRMHAKALALGAQDEGAAGPRSEGFYCGYFRDLDGNKLNVFFMG